MKHSFMFFLLTLISLFACQKQNTDNKQEKAEVELRNDKNNTENSAKSTEVNPFLISCEGIGKVKFSMKYTDLEKMFGKKNLQSDTVFAGTPMMDGERTDEDRISTTVNAPEGKIYLTWAAGKEAKKIEKISILASDKPQYKFANGISVGSTFAEFQKANAKGEFEFYGFGWQYGGIIINETAQGAFFKNFPCFTGNLRPKNDDYDKVQNLMGDGKFKASQVKPQEANEIYLYEITLLNQ